MVRLDVETGGLAIERLWGTYDVGRAVDPIPIEARIAGGALQGVDGALRESAHDLSHGVIAAVVRLDTATDGLAIERL